MAAFRLALYAGALALVGAMAFLAVATAHGQTPGTPACQPRFRLRLDLRDGDPRFGQRDFRLEIDQRPFGDDLGRVPYVAPRPSVPYPAPPSIPPYRYDPRDCPVCPPPVGRVEPYGYAPPGGGAPGGYQEYSRRPAASTFTPAVGPPPPRVVESRSPLRR